MRLYEKPLALYLFGKNRETFDRYVMLLALCYSSSTLFNLILIRIMGTITSGGVCVNDTLMHVVGNLPFGGVGPSGVGSYHGKLHVQ
jgi:acyl-CoA reductase-like NAD-dependent aldehyde dehydrogenase